MLSSATVVVSAVVELMIPLVFARLRSRKVGLSVGAKMLVDPNAEFPHVNATSAIGSSAFVGNNFVDSPMLGFTVRRIPSFSKLEIHSEFTSGMA